tara:strand:+ start:4980 stop:5633 length:654 start_codon:yes stop_codon:yes gene_type:complete
MKKIIFSIIMTIMSLSHVQFATATPILMTNSSGNLTGINGLEVLHTYSQELLGVYDVIFRDGSCLDLFNGCDSNQDDLLFRNSAVGGYATESLLGALGAFADMPEKITGCESILTCIISIPININLSGPSSSVSASSLWLRKSPLDDLPITESYVGSRETDFSSFTNRTWAIFSPSLSTGNPPNTVPEPGMLALIGLGFASFGIIRRRNKIGENHAV